MGTVVISTVSKQHIEDMQGQVAASELAAAGFGQFGEVRVGRRIVLTVDGPVTKPLLAQARDAAEKVLLKDDSEEIVSVKSKDDEDASAPWDDFEATWGGDDATAGPDVPEPRVAAVRRPIEEADLGSVESGSIAAYDDSDD
ncbi:MAG: phosphoribosylformylglycinamidine synthase subunit PurS [Dermatophilus congolensis]|nr:phosphoribosylformylglycinamidine synthase subunit PurS [Dermatophilus congolensis]